MADKGTQPQVYPVPESYDPNQDAGAQRDPESGTAQFKDQLTKKKRIKCLAYTLGFVVFQTGIILLYAMIIMKIRTPKFRVQSASFDSFEVGSAPNPSFHLRMNAQVGVKNSNFEAFKFQGTPIVFLYDGTPVGQSIVPATQAGWRTTKKLNVAVDLSSDNFTNGSQLGKDLNSGILKLNALSTLSGKVRVTWIFNKKKTANMNCTIAIGLAYRTVLEINCQ